VLDLQPSVYAREWHDVKQSPIYAIPVRENQIHRDGSVADRNYGKTSFSERLREGTIPVALRLEERSRERALPSIQGSKT
jgi:hypothetical protein